ncbi:hypothetical protein BJ085DRAFT_34123 [Dimargaris cristalligena]|uniref:Histone chaperone RTT106/FACT complex subunit SPT16-like middle domain-containing protein n=1 Tax=Dimargaris cristalligena TaxID=215637 RepID=A0A4V1J4W8_9FUNG|nr:hypothetical protein BJ085DRAFT_34123 [Dimargaris cristalligena]|eukprot:RKP37009.1 hypothetical protein BJ085DRAFT_34123 [Dimargaris cristalligena]
MPAPADSSPEPPFLATLSDLSLRRELGEFLRQQPTCAPLIERLIGHLTLTPGKRPRAPDAVATTTSWPQDREYPCHIPDLAFSLPRKRLDCCFTTDQLVLTATKPEQPPHVEAAFPLSSVVRVLLVPTPDKPKPHWTVVLTMAADGDPQVTHLVFGLAPDTPALPVSEADPTEAGLAPSSISSPHPNIQRLLTVFTRYLPPKTPLLVPAPGPPGTPAKCYWKAKEGHLYFLDEGVLFGFKKPILFFPRSEIQDLEVLGITSRTFNLHLHWLPNAHPHEQPPSKRHRVPEGQGAASPALSETIEFGMIDYAEFDRITDYIRRQQIAARSFLDQLNHPGPSTDPKHSIADSNLTIANMELGNEAGDGDEDDDNDFDPDAANSSDSSGGDSDSDSDSLAGEHSDPSQDSDSDHDEVPNGPAFSSDNDLAEEVDLDSDGSDG